MSLKNLIRFATVAGALGTVIGIAPVAASAWGTDQSTQASCWRAWLSDDATYGGDGRNRTYLGTSENGSEYNNFFIRIDAYFKHNGVNKDFVRQDGDGLSRARDTYNNGVSGDRTWTVDAYGQEAPGKTSTQKHSSCVIT